ncbi:NlpC/P60 family protein [uncultured Mediterranea sp.]|uniref:C40 family peptidase n=1 Tax=uncultured Mediterranea sp. TaxID=1926662 RepID=UPI0027D9C248|nr:NlpC/P60 family protein [uncultured Mediterranea sp.]
MTGRLYRLLLPALLLCLSSCHTSAPRLDYRALARASVQLGMDIGPKDNHRLYLTAAEWIGTPYRSGGHTKRGTDCSGLTGEIYRKVYRVRLPRSTGEQLAACRKVARRGLKEGDLVFFHNGKSRKKVTHVGIYLKDGKFVHASTSRGVIVSSLDENYWRRCWMRGGRP